MKKILVTGGAGFIGSNLIAKLLENPYCRVSALDDFSTGEILFEDCDYYDEDIEDINELDPDEFGTVFHLAGLSRIQPSFIDPKETLRVNATGTHKVLEWARGHNIKVIYAGSSSRHYDPYQSPYAISKYIGEELCKMYRRVYGMTINIARFYNVYGKNEILEGDFSAVIGRWRGQIARGEALTIIGNGEQRRDFTHVDDIVDALIKISELDDYHVDAWELGRGSNISINELYDIFKKHFPGIEKVYIPEVKGNYRTTMRKNDDALALLDWRPKGNLEDYIKSLREEQ